MASKKKIAAAVATLAVAGGIGMATIPSAETPSEVIMTPLEEQRTFTRDLKGCAPDKIITIWRTKMCETTPK